MIIIMTDKMMVLLLVLDLAFTLKLELFHNYKLSINCKTK